MYCFAKRIELERVGNEIDLAKSVGAPVGSGHVGRVSRLYYAFYG